MLGENRGRDVNPSPEANPAVRSPSKDPLVQMCGWEGNQAPSKAWGSLWGRAGKPKKPASPPGLVLAGKRVTPRSAVLEQEGKWRPLPEEPISSRARPRFQVETLLAKEDVSSGCDHNGRRATLQKWLCWILTRITDGQSGASVSKPPASRS